MSIVQDRRVVVTGKIAGESRITAEAKLREAGAIVQSAVGKDTDVLVTGSAVGLTKLNKARDLGVEIVPWEEAFSGGNGNAKPVAPPRAPLPSVRQWAPMLCKPTDTIPTGRWAFEIKWDGHRGIATIKDGCVALWSRSGKSDFTQRFPEVVAELAELGCDCVLDGELVEIDGTSRYMVFDILAEYGDDITKLPLNSRRKILGATLADGVHVGVSPIFDDGEVLLTYAIEEGLEGIVAKKLDSSYVEGARNDNWLKLKIRREQEFVVLGYTAGEGHRAWAFGALILGYYEGAEIRYAGKVGTGFDDDCLTMLMAEMEPMKRETEIEDERSWIVPNDVSREATWIYPGIVVDVAYQKWTEDGMLWHPSYQRLRTDKSPFEVRLEITL